MQTVLESLPELATYFRPDDSFGKKLEACSGRELQARFECACGLAVVSVKGIEHGRSESSLPDSGAWSGSTKDLIYTHPMYALRESRKYAQVIQSLEDLPRNGTPRDRGRVCIILNEFTILTAHFEQVKIWASAALQLLVDNQYKNIKIDKKLIGKVQNMQASVQKRLTDRLAALSRNLFHSINDCLANKSGFVDIITFLDLRNRYHQLMSDTDQDVKITGTNTTDKLLEEFTENILGVIAGQQKVDSKINDLLKFYNHLRQHLKPKIRKKADDVLKGYIGLTHFTSQFKADTPKGTLAELTEHFFDQIEGSTPAGIIVCRGVLSWLEDVMALSHTSKLPLDFEKPSIDSLEVINFEAKKKRELPNYSKAQIELVSIVPETTFHLYLSDLLNYNLFVFEHGAELTIGGLSDTLKNRSEFLVNRYCDDVNIIRNIEIPQHESRPTLLKLIKGVVQSAAIDDIILKRNQSTILNNLHSYFFSQMKMEYAHLELTEDDIADEYNVNAGLCVTNALLYGLTQLQVVQKNISGSCMSVTTSELLQEEVFRSYGKSHIAFLQAMSLECRSSMNYVLTLKEDPEHIAYRLFKSFALKVLEGADVVLTSKALSSVALGIVPSFSALLERIYELPVGQRFAHAEMLAYLSARIARIIYSYEAQFTADDPSSKSIKDRTELQACFDAFHTVAGKLKLSTVGTPSTVSSVILLSEMAAKILNDKQYPCMPPFMCSPNKLIWEKIEESLPKIYSAMQQHLTEAFPSEPDENTVDIRVLGFVYSFGGNNNARDELRDLVKSVAQTYLVDIENIADYIQRTRYHEIATRAESVKYNESLLVYSGDTRSDMSAKSRSLRSAQKSTRSTPLTAPKSNVQPSIDNGAGRTTVKAHPLAVTVEQGKKDLSQAREECARAKRTLKMMTLITSMISHPLSKNELAREKKAFSQEGPVDFKAIMEEKNYPKSWLYSDAYYDDQISLLGSMFVIHRLENGNDGTFLRPEIETRIRISIMLLERLLRRGYEAIVEGEASTDKIEFGEENQYFKLIYYVYEDLRYFLERTPKATNDNLESDPFSIAEMIDDWNIIKGRFGPLTKMFGISSATLDSITLSKFLMTKYLKEDGRKILTRTDHPGQAAVKEALDQLSKSAIPLELPAISDSEDEAVVKPVAVKKKKKKKKKSKAAAAQRSNEDDTIESDMVAEISSPKSSAEKPTALSPESVLTNLENKPPEVERAASEEGRATTPVALKEAKVHKDEPAPSSPIFTPARHTTPPPAEKSEPVSISNADFIPLTLTGAGEDRTAGQWRVVGKSKKSKHEKPKKLEISELPQQDKKMWNRSKVKGSSTVATGQIAITKLPQNHSDASASSTHRSGGSPWQKLEGEHAKGEVPISSTSNALGPMHFPELKKQTTLSPVAETISVTASPLAAPKAELNHTPPADNLAKPNEVPIVELAKTEPAHLKKQKTAQKGDKAQVVNSTPNNKASTACTTAGTVKISPLPAIHSEKATSVVKDEKVSVEDNAAVMANVLAKLKKSMGHLSVADKAPKGRSPAVLVVPAIPTLLTQPVITPQRVHQSTNLTAQKAPTAPTQADYMVGLHITAKLSELNKRHSIFYWSNIQELPWIYRASIGIYGDVMRLPAPNEVAPGYEFVRAIWVAKTANAKSNIELCNMIYKGLISGPMGGHSPHYVNDAHPEVGLERQYDCKLKTEYDDLETVCTELEGYVNQWDDAMVTDAKVACIRAANYLFTIRAQHYFCDEEKAPRHWEARKENLVQLLSEIGQRTQATLNELLVKTGRAPDVNSLIALGAEHAHLQNALRGAVHALSAVMVRSPAFRHGLLDSCLPLLTVSLNASVESAIQRQYSDLQQMTPQNFGMAYNQGPVSLLPSPR